MTIQPTPLRVLAALLLAVLPLVACGGGSGGSSNIAPPADPTSAILGTWEFGNDVGTLSYEFTPDGRFLWRSQNRFQKLDARGAYAIDGARIVLTFDDDPTGEMTSHLVFVGSDRIREAEEEEDAVTYARR